MAYITVRENKNSLHNRSVRVTLRPKHKNLIHILQRFVWNDDLSIPNDSALSLKTGYRFWYPYHVIESCFYFPNDKNE